MSKPQKKKRPKNKDSRATPRAKDSFGSKRYIYRDAAKNTQALIEAVANDDLSRIQKMIAGGADLNLCDEGGLSPLHHAAMAGKCEMVRAFAAGGANLNIGQDGKTKESKTGRVPLQLALDAPNAKEVIDLLLALGADANVVDRLGRTPLHDACYGGPLEAAKALLPATRNIDALDVDARTPLHHACLGDRKETVDLMMEMRADFMRADKTGATCLHYAADGKKGAAALSLLETHALALLNTVDLAGRTPLHRAIEAKTRVVVKNMLDAGANASLADKKGETPLTRAVIGNEEVLVDMLIDAGADIERRGADEKRPALCIAAQNNNGKMLERLLARGASPDVQDQNGISALMICASMGNIDAVNTLLEQGANAALLDHQKRGVFYYMSSVFKRSDIQRLAAAGADVHGVDAVGRTALMHAIDKNNGGHAVTFLELGAKADIFDAMGYSPLHLALQRRLLGLCETLIRKGADVRAVNKLDGSTPLHLACAAGFSALVRDILKTGVDVNVKDNHGTTPLAYAVGNSPTSVDVVALLLAAGANPVAENNMRVTPFDVAFAHGKYPVVDLFKKALNKTGKNYQPKPVPYMPPWGY